MTRAPANILAVRSLLLTHLDVDPKSSRPQDLEPAEVGIVGDASHRGGYHCGSDRVVSGDYSVVESPRDSSGLTLDSSALDVGQFSVKLGGSTHDLRSFSVWCVQQCAAGAPDTRDIREIIYSPDGKTVKRWDRLGRRSTGDSSHLWHTHFSFFRDAIRAGRDLTPLFRRYLTEIGLLAGEGTIMFCKLGDSGEHVQAVQVMCNALLDTKPIAEDGKYGPATADAVLAVRRSVGSKQTDGNVYDAHAYAQFMQAMAVKFGGGGQPAPLPRELAITGVVTVSVPGQARA